MSKMKTDAPSTVHTDPIRERNLYLVLTSLLQALLVIGLILWFESRDASEIQDSAHPAPLMTRA